MLGIDAAVHRPEFTTCESDRPLFVQFCAHDPQYLVKAGQIVAPQTDYVDINFGGYKEVMKPTIIQHSLVVRTSDCWLKWT